MTVHFIGAGPGAADLITVRGLKLLQSCPICLYAGSLIPQDLLQNLPKHIKCINSQDMILDDIIAIFKQAHSKNQNVSRLHSGDPSLYGAIAEQIRLLDAHSIDYDITPGVPAFVAAAAAMKQELTLPGLNQSIILTRTAKNSSKMPEKESLANFGATGATLIIHLSAMNSDIIMEQLIPFYGAQCNAVIASHISHENEKIVYTTLENLGKSLQDHNIKSTALIFVGPALKQDNFLNSYLYSKKN